MENFVVEHTVCPGWYFNKKLGYVELIDAYVFKTEKEFYDEADIMAGRCKYTIMKKMYKFVTVEELKNAIRLKNEKRAEQNEK